MCSYYVFRVFVYGMGFYLMYGGAIDYHWYNQPNALMKMIVDDFKHAFYESADTTWVCSDRSLHGEYV